MRRLVLIGLVVVAASARADDQRRPRAIGLGWLDRKDCHLPVVATQPPGMGRILNKWFREMSRPVSCRVDLLAPGAIDVSCAHGDRTTRDFFWLERGFPAVELHELGFDEVTIDSPCKQTCRFDTEHFALDTGGLVFQPADACTCPDLPRVPLSELAPRDKRAELLVAWLKARADAGDDAVSWSMSDWRPVPESP